MSYLLDIFSSDPFIAQTILSFLIGSIWITALSLFSERLGSKIGGAIAAIPATMVVALAFVGITQSAQSAVATTTIIPLMLGVNVIMVVIFLILLSRLRFWMSFTLSLCAWLLLANITIALNPAFVISLLVYMIVVLGAYFVVEHRLTIVSAPGMAVKPTIIHIIFRSLIAGMTIGAAVLAAKYSGPTPGGVFATFPALTVALMLIFRTSGSERLLPSLLKNFIIVGTLNVSIFVITVRWAYSMFGVGWGTAIALAVSLFAAYIFYILINKNMK